MATNSRTYPNDYFAWYNDDQRLAVLSRDTTSTTSGERTTEKYDTFQGDGDLSGTITDADCSTTTITITSASHGLETGDRVSVSGTTNFNDDNLANQTVTVTSVDAFTMTRSSSSSATDETGTWTSLFVDNGLRITYHSRYESVSAITEDLNTDIGLDEGMHNAIVYYTKARLYEDSGNFEQAMYFRNLFKQLIKRYPSRKSGIRQLAVPRM